MRIATMMLVLLVAAGCDHDRKVEPTHSPRAGQTTGGPAVSHEGSAGEARATWSAAGKLWADKMIETLPDAFCMKGSYFSTCFTQSAAECRKLAESQTRTCLDLHPEVVPREVNAETGRAAGQELGTCAGGSFERELRKRGKFTDTAQCNDLEYWARVSQEQARNLPNQ